LELADWDPTQAVLTIRQAKFGQSRYVPLAASAATALNAYLVSGESRE
jgi:site-specific recombinase XerD